MNAETAIARCAVLLGLPPDATPDAVTEELASRVGRKLPPLTRRQKDVLDAIRSFIACEGISPTFEELGNVLGLSKVTVWHHARALEKKGTIRWGGRNTRRSLSLVGFEETGGESLPPG